VNESRLANVVTPHSGRGGVSGVGWGGVSEVTCFVFAYGRPAKVGRVALLSVRRDGHPVVFIYSWVVGSAREQSG